MEILDLKQLLLKNILTKETYPTNLSTPLLLILILLIINKLLISNRKKYKNNLYKIIIIDSKIINLKRYHQVKLINILIYMD